jgi:hypothetical protein
MDVHEYLSDNSAVLNPLSEVFDINRKRIRYQFPGLVEDYGELKTFFSEREDPKLGEFQATDFDTQKYIDAGVVEKDGFDLEVDETAFRWLEVFYNGIESRVAVSGNEDASEDFDELVEGLVLEYEREERTGTEAGDVNLNQGDFESGGDPEWF